MSKPCWKIILGNNQIGLTGPLLDLTMCWTGAVKAQSGRWRLVSPVVPSRWCTSLLHDTTWIVTVSFSELHLVKLMLSSSLEHWPTKWLQPCAKSTTKCQSLVGLSRWDHVPTVAAITTTPTPSSEDATESSQSIFTFRDVHQQLKHFSMASSSSKRRSSAWRRCRCGTESKFTILGKNLVCIEIVDDIKENLKSVKWNLGNKICVNKNTASLKWG